MVKLDIISDPICPWCYIGKANLDKALSAFPDHPFDIEWHPFQLNPDMPQQGMDRRTYLETKFGSKEAAVKAYTPVVEHAKTAGVTINLEKMKRTPNTIDAHRLIHWAGLEGRQTAAVSALFKAYFETAVDIADHRVLCDIAKQIDMDPDVIARLLNSEEDKALILERDAHSRAKGVQSVPTFIVANHHVLPGAQSPELWTQVIQELIENLNG